MSEVEAKVIDIDPAPNGTSPHGGHTTRRLVAVTAIWAVTVIAAIGAWLLAAVAESDGFLADQVIPTDVAGTIFSLTMATFGALVIARGEHPGYGWLMLSYGAVTALIDLSGHYALYSFGIDLPMTAAAIWVQDQFVIGWILGFLLLPALFPQGRAVTPRWRRAVWLVAAGWLIYDVYFAFADRRSENYMYAIPEASRPPNPLGVLPSSEIALGLPWLVLSLLTIAVAIGGLMTRWRRSRGTETAQQIKWVAFAFMLLLGLFALDLVTEVLESELGVELGVTGALEVLVALATVGLAVVWGLAVLRFRLHQVDMVINRTVVYGLLTAIITSVYVAVVAGIGSVLTVDQTGLVLVATGLVAVGFAPVRDLVQGGVNRMMFGQRDDPYLVMSALGRLMAEAGTPEETLQTLVETVAGSLRLPGAEIELENDGAWEVRASFGSIPVSGSRAEVVPLRDQGELVGRLTVSPRSPREPLSTRDRAVLADLAGPAAAVARSVRLTTALQASRERLVLAREEERRRVRRDLHDGLGPSLAAQTFQLDEILDRVQSNPAQAAGLVRELKRNNQQLVSDVRRLVNDLRPPALDELGLAGALEAHVGQLDGAIRLKIDVNTDPDPLPDVPAAVEVAAYHIAREAMTNAMRHAEASSCVTTLTASQGRLVISVRDDGSGIGTDTNPGVGLQSMRERTEELGGSLVISVGDRSGTEVVAYIPIHDGRVEVMTQNGAPDV